MTGLKSTVFLFKAIFTLCVLTPLPAFAQTGEIQIHGKPDISITVDEKMVGKTLKNENGLLLKEVPPGPHILTATSPGYYSETFIVEVKSNQTTTFGVVLKIDKNLIEGAPPQKNEEEPKVEKEPIQILISKTSDQDSYLPIDAINIWERGEVQESEWLNVVTKVCNSILFQIPKEKDWVFSGYKVINDNSMDVYVQPDGIITFHTGILNFMKNEHELAMVCGHEIGHVTNRHFEEDEQTHQIATLVKEFIDKEMNSPVIDFVRGDTLGEVVGGAIIQKYSRSQERESDETGLFYAWDAGFDPRAGMELWARMAQERDRAEKTYRPFYSRYLDSHPVDKERMENYELLMERGCKENIRRKYCTDFLTIDRQYKKTLSIYEKYKSK